MITSKVIYLFPFGRIIGRLSKGIDCSGSLEGPCNQTQDMAPASAPLLLLLLPLLVFLLLLLLTKGVRLRYRILLLLLR